jgi:hypothetical protein
MIRRAFLLKLAELQAAADFDRRGHAYYRADGSHFGGVTGTIRRAAEAGLLSWTPPPQSVYKPIHRQRGTAVHRAAELHDTGRLDESTVDSRIRGYVDAWESFAQVWGMEWDAIETPIACEDLGYAGTPDRVRLGDCRRTRGRIVVLDIKTGKSAKPPRGWEIQTMAYARMFGERAALRSIRLAVQLGPEGRFRVEERSGPIAAKDLADWERCLKFLRNGAN